MDKQFHTLARSYTDNYVQYQTTGVKSHQIAYKSAEEGIQRILQSIQKPESKPTVEEPSISLHAQRDQKVAAKMRQSPSSFSVSHTTQYVTLGLLSAAVIGLLMI